MAIYGSIIKEVITLRNKLEHRQKAVLNQEKVLRHLLHKATRTDFGKQYHFAEILRNPNVLEEFSRSVPVFDFKKMHTEWWHKVENGVPDVTWPGRPEYLALSSGTTTGKSKKIPVTADMLRATRKASIRQITRLAEFDVPPDLYEKEIMMLSGCTTLHQPGPYPEGDISGINAANIPGWFKSYYRPGTAIAGIEDWDERVQNISEKAPEWDIGALSGIPSWIELMLKKIISHHQLNNIHDIWPNLRIFATGGVAFGPYKKGFEKLLRHPLIYIDTYFCSEGFLAFQTRPHTSAMSLITDNGVYFEFIPFNETNFTAEGDVRPNAPVLTYDETKEGVDYALLISTVSGAWRYLIGDTIRIVNKENDEIIITGRTSQFLNVVGSKLSVNMMDVAIQKMAKELNIAVKEFTVAALLDEDAYAHQWYIGSDDVADPEQAVKLLDETLQEMNRSYSTARKQALEHVKIKFIPPEIFYKWNELTNKKGGQVKMPRVMKEEQFREWEKFVSQELNSSTARSVL